MQVRTLTATQGWRWLGGGFALFRRNPATLTLLMFACLVLFLTLHRLPLIGWTLASVAIPTFSVFLMNACRDVDQGRPPGVAVLVVYLRSHWPRMLTLGVIYFATLLLALVASSIADDGAYMRTALGLREVTEEDVASGAFVAPMQIAMLVLLPSIMAMWFAPMLVAWQGFTPGKALFFSFVACLRNWLPFLTYCLCMILFGAMLPGLLLGVALAVLPIPQIMTIGLCMMPVFFVIAPSIVASFYVSYRDVFSDDDAPVTPTIDEEA